MIARNLKASVDLAAFVSQFTRLRRVGRQLVGLCPIHHESHPSFYVHPQKQVFYCFGCGAGGDLFAFVMHATSCDFRRALQIASEFSDRVARGSEPRSGSRFGAGVGGEAPSARKAGAPNSQSTQDARARVLEALDATNRRLRAIEAANRAAAVSLATACEPERGGCLLLEKTK